MQVMAEKEPHRYDEDYEIGRLQSDDSRERSKAAAALLENGGRDAAGKLEGVILANGFPREVKRDIGNVLLSLSFRDVHHLAKGPGAADREARRKVALAMALPFRI